MQSLFRTDNFYNLCRFAAYFVYILFVVYLLSKAPDFTRILKTESIRSESTAAFIGAILVMYFYPIFIGILLAIPDFISKLQKTGVWKYNWVKFLGIGIPTLYISVSPIWGWLVLMTLGRKIPFAILPVNLNQTAISFSGIIFGFIFLNCFYKQNLQFRKRSFF